MATNPIYKGNTTKNFGRNLPCPYIERIELWDVPEEMRETLPDELGFDPGAEKISRLKVFVSLLMHTDDAFRLDDFIENLFNDLNLNFVVLTGAGQIENLSNNRANLKTIITSMSAAASETDGADPDTDADAASPVSGFGSQIHSVSLTDYAAEIAFTGEYDENTNMILKSSNITYEIYVPMIKELTDLTLFAGVSLGNPADLLGLQDVVMALSFGDLAYEHIKRAGTLNTKNKVGFFDNEGAFYTGKPMLATSGRYHKSDHFEQYSQYLGSDDGDLESVFDSLDTIWAEYDTDPSYLMMLNRYRRNISNQDVTTKAGQFYQRFTILVNNVNSKLLEAPEVKKKITHSSKIRDYRPSQWFPSTEATYDDDLQDHDYLYQMILQTSLAKYVSAASDTGEDSLFQPEAPYSPSEMKDRYKEAITEILKRFSGDFTANRTTLSGGEYGFGMDNVSQWLDDNAEYQVNVAVNNFKNAIGRFISWGTTREWVDGSGGSGFLRDSGTAQRVYRGDYNDDNPEYDSDNLPAWWTYTADERGSGLTWGSHNWYAWNSVQHFFGHKGNPRNCTLEFGYDSSQPSAGTWNKSFLNRDIGNEAGTGGTVRAVVSNSAFHQYKCFYQEIPLINVLGYGDRNNTDPQGSEPPDGRWGYYLVVRDKSSQSSDSWNLRSVDWLSEQIEEYLREEDTIFGSSAEIFDIIVASVELIYNKLDHRGSEFITAIQAEDRWNNWVSEYDLLDDEGGVRSGKLNDFARAYAQSMEDLLFGALDGFAYGDSDERGDVPYFYHGGLGGGRSDGLGAGNRMDDSAETGVGRYSFNLAREIADAVVHVWNRYWKQDVKDAVKDIVPLLAEYHGLNMSTGLHRRLAHMDIIVQKYGYFFFDLEKYIQKRSIISRYMNPRTFQKYFEWGRDMINHTIRIDDVTFERWNAQLVDGQWRAMGSSPGGFGTHRDTGTRLVMEWNPESGYNAQPTDIRYLKFNGTGMYGGVSAGTVPYARVKTMDVGGWTDIGMEKDEAGEDVLMDLDSDTEIPSYAQWSYLMWRNYDFAYDEKVPDSYRMALFAYNYYVDDDVAIAAPDAMHIEITVRDRSDRIMYYLKSIMNGINFAFQEYVEMASENCAYNTFDSSFNDFFTNYMDDLYGDNMMSAPWLRAAAAYVIFDDLFYGRYGGEFGIVMDAARSIADSINPYTGDLESVLDYGQKFQDMYDQVVSLYSDVYDEMFDDGDRIYEKVVHQIGSTMRVFGAAVGGDEELIVNNGIIDYASDRTGEFPELPDPDMSQP